MSKIKLLLAEDEPALGQIVQESLETRDFDVTLCKDGAQALEKFNNGEFAILVLDVMMPKMDGFTLAKKIRETNEEIPIIFLTAKSQTADVVEGFSIGGNDYMKKPFSVEELIVRIHNLLGRTKLQRESEVLEIGDYRFDFPRQILRFRESGNESQEEQNLTHREAHLLFHLVKNKNQVLDRSLILKKLWGDDDFFSGRSMDVFITKLRKKLSNDPNVSIVNVRGYGYKLIC
ncbi:DNA-binding response regulator [Dokdonia sinensis]|uniref:DNA-binding response regulator n=1 Tax=Dokdonia sinensis TaxID=2479847 RepID=A0A3M0G6C6_9FLAO|nr:response regulator transcription factor [Dokdonia sinensis]RMB56659.1 DNA-binding response regulator [Dokdonia sinensis]